MPLYFFDVYDGEMAVRDEAGVELDSVAEAADRAAALLPDLARDVLPGWPSRNFATLVRDEDETVVYRAALLYRGQKVGGEEVRAGPRSIDAEELILRSRETRAAARQASARLQHGVDDLLTAIEATLRTASQMRAERAARS